QVSQPMPQPAMPSPRATAPMTPAAGVGDLNDALHTARTELGVQNDMDRRMDTGRKSTGEISLRDRVYSATRDASYLDPKQRGANEVLQRATELGLTSAPAESSGTLANFGPGFIQGSM